MLENAKLELIVDLKRMALNRDDVACKQMMRKLKSLPAQDRESFIKHYEGVVNAWKPDNRKEIIDVSGQVRKDLIEMTKGPISERVNQGNGEPRTVISVQARKRPRTSSWVGGDEVDASLMFVELPGYVGCIGGHYHTQLATTQTKQW